MSALVYIGNASIITQRGLRVAQSYRCRQCEGREAWERVTRFSRFSFFCSYRSGESAEEKKNCQTPIWAN